MTSAQTWGMEPNSLRKMLLNVDLTLTEFVILALVVCACLSALLEFARFMGGLK